MEDAHTIVLPPGPACGDDPGMRQVVELFADTVGVRSAELVIRWKRSNREQILQIGRIGDQSVSVSIGIDDDVMAVLTLAGEVLPPQHTLDLFAAAIDRELQRLRLLAESVLLRGALDASTAAILLFGPSGSILFANRRADELISKQTQDELTVNRDGSPPQPLFRILCAKVGDHLDGAARQASRERLEISDGSELTTELVMVDAGAEGLGPVVLAVLREITGSPNRRVDDFAELYRLSPREREVLLLLVQGLDTPGLADRLGISPHTVRDHLKNVFRKTSNRSRSELLSALTGVANHSET